MKYSAYVQGLGQWQPEIHSATPAARLLPTRVRGRASLLTRMFAEVAEQALQPLANAQTLSDIPSQESTLKRLAEMPTIFGSAYGEVETTLALLHSLFKEAGFAQAGALSPAKFQASVHNTASGILSITSGNRHYTTSLAAGPATVAMGFVEAFSWLHTQRGNVLLAFAEEASSNTLNPTERFSALAAAFWLSSEPRAENPLQIRLDLVHEPNTTQQNSLKTSSPCQPALGLIKNLLSPRQNQMQNQATLAVPLSSVWCLHISPNPYVL